MARCGGAQKLAEHLQLPYTATRGRRRREEGLPQQLVQQQLRLQLRLRLWLHLWLQLLHLGWPQPEQQPLGQGWP